MNLKINSNFFIIIIIIYLIYSLSKKKCSYNVENFSNNEWIKKNWKKKFLL